MASTRTLQMATAPFTLSYQAVHHKAVSEAQLLEHYVAAATAAGLDPIVDDKVIRLANDTRLRWHQDAYSNWHVKGDAPENDRSSQWLQSMASLAGASPLKPAPRSTGTSHRIGTAEIAPIVDVLVAKLTVRGSTCDELARYRAFTRLRERVAA